MLLERLFLSTSAGAFAALLAIFVHPNPSDQALYAAGLFAVGIPVSVFAYFWSEMSQTIAKTGVKLVLEKASAGLTVGGQALHIGGFVLILSAIHDGVGLAFAVTASSVMAVNLLIYFRIVRPEEKSSISDI